MLKKDGLFALVFMAGSSACSHPSSATNTITDNGSADIAGAAQPESAIVQENAAPSTAPAGWTVQWSAGGDLNGDGVADRASLLKQDDNGSRRLIVSFGKAGGSSSTAADTETFLPKIEDGTDPFADDNPLEIKNRTLRIVVPGTGMDFTNETYTFRYQNGQFELIGFDSHNQEKASGDYDDESVNYSTGIVEHRKGNIERTKDVVTRSRLPNGSKPTLASINLTDGFTPPSTGDAL